MLYRSFIYGVILIVFLPLLLRSLTMAPVSGSTFDSFIILCFGGIYLSSSPDILELFISMIPYVLVLYLFSTYMREDFAINCTYVFTRMGKKQKWLFEKSLYLFLRILCVFALLFAEASIIYAFASPHMFQFSPTALSTVLSVFALNVLAIYCLSFAQNFVSLLLGGTIPFLITSMFYIASVLLALFLRNKNAVFNTVLSILVPSNQMYIWHTDSVGFAMQGGFSYKSPINGYYLPFSYIILPVSIMAAYLIARRLLLHSDLTEFAEET